MLPVSNMYLPVNFESIVAIPNGFVQFAFPPCFPSAYVTQALSSVTISSWVLFSSMDSPVVQDVQTRCSVFSWELVLTLVLLMPENSGKLRFVCGHHSWRYSGFERGKVIQQPLTVAPRCLIDRQLCSGHCNIDTRSWLGRPRLPSSRTTITYNSCLPGAWTRAHKTSSSPTNEVRLVRPSKEESGYLISLESAPNVEMRSSLIWRFRSRQLTI